MLIDGPGYAAAFVVVTAVLLGSTALMALLRVQDPLRRSAAAAQRAAQVERPPAPERSAPARARQPSVAAARPGVWGLLGNVGVQLAVLSSAGVFVAVAVRQAFLPVYLQSLDVSATRIGLLLSLGGLAAVMVRPVMPSISRALGGSARALVAAMLAVAVSVAVTGAIGDYGLLVAVTVLAGVGTGVGLPLSIVTVASHVDARQRGVALGVRLSLNRVAQLAAPVAIGAVIAASGFALGFALAGAALGLLAIAAAARVPRFEAAAEGAR